MKKEKPTGDEKKKALPGYPPYPSEEDIYNNETEEENMDPENPSTGKEPPPRSGGQNMGNDLDVPGSELDDEDEFIGEEDEENNYYSLGGDEHNDLDEDEDRTDETGEEDDDEDEDEYDKQ